MGKKNNPAHDKEHRLVWVADKDLEERVQENDRKAKSNLVKLAFGTLGVVYGDIGTSPLYTVGSVFSNAAPIDDNQLKGTFSMIFWTITVVVLIKYVLIMLMADDRGEGGIISLYALIKRGCALPNFTELHSMDEDLNEVAPPNSSKLSRFIARSLNKIRWLQIALLIVVLGAVNFIISDGVLTPAISVVSAVEGIQFNTGISNNAVVGISIGILVVLFFLQSFGTEKISFIFSPVLLLWFASLAAMGLYNIITWEPSIFEALSPHYIYYFWSGDSHTAWINLGSTMLSITGAEALYADLGHFNRKSIQLSFFCVVYPSLTLTYLGQIAYVIHNKDSASQAFWASIPQAVYIPIVVVATMAAIIASQALITGAFSIARQGVAIKIFPRFTVKHTSDHAEGQVYLPEINYALLLGVVLIVVIMQTSTQIGNAYGLAIIIVMIIDTFLLSLVMLCCWNWNQWLVIAFYWVNTFIAAAYLSSNLLKVPQGAWFTLALAAILSVIAYTYWWGQAKKVSYIKKNTVPLVDLFEEGTVPSTKRFHNTHGTVLSTADTLSVNPDLTPVQLVGTKCVLARLPGVGIYYTESLDGLPPVLVQFISLSPAIHEVVIFLTIRRVALPSVDPTLKLLMRKMEVDGFYHVVARYGYMEQVDLGDKFVGMVVEELLEYLQSDILDDVEEAASQVSFDSHGNPLIVHHDVEAMDALSDDGGVTMNTQYGRKVLAQIQSKLSSGRELVAIQNDNNGNQTLQQRSRPLTLSTMRATTMPIRFKNEDTIMVTSDSTVRQLVVSSSRNYSRQASADRAAFNSLSLPGSSSSQRPWVRQPSTMNRAFMQSYTDAVATSTKNFDSGSEAAGVSTGAVNITSLPRDTAVSLPLPPPPSRPPIHRMSSTLFTRPGTGEHGGGPDAMNTNNGTATAATAGMTDLSAASLDNSSALDRRMLEEKELARQRADKYARERYILLEAYTRGVVHLLGRAELKASSSSKYNRFWNFWRKILINGFYQFLTINTRPASADYKLPEDSLMEVTGRYHV